MTKLVVRRLGNVPYEETWQRMKTFTEKRDSSTYDELWLLEHPAVYTLGQTRKFEHIISPGEIPVVKTDRGGQVTYHGPGQLVVYLLLDIRRLGVGIRTLVSGIERSIITLLVRNGIQGMTRKGSPGVYVAGRKIAALGLRIKKGRSYHGMSLNVDMDLAPFANINPCGHEGLEVVDLKTLGSQMTVAQVEEQLAATIGVEFGYDAVIRKKLNKFEQSDG